MRGRVLAASAAALSLVLGAGGASAAVVTVDGTAGPWSTAANPGFGYADDSAETASTTVAVPGGDHVFISYVSGSTTTDGNLSATADANGYCCLLGHGFNAPGNYTNRAPALMELVGVFTDASGVILGTPFVVGDGPHFAVAPAGASFLSLGVNDNQYHDNTGALQISVNATAAPEPSAWAMMLIGVGGLGGLLRAARRRATAAA